MKSILLIKELSSLKTHLNEEQISDFSYIYLGNQNSIENYLFSNCLKKIHLKDFKEKYGKDFLKNYIDFIGKLSVKYNSLYWWSNSLSEKNTFLTNLHINIYHSLLITRIILHEDINKLILLTENSKINEILIQFCREKKINFQIIGNSKNNDQSHGHLKVIKFLKSTLRLIKQELSHRHISKRISYYQGKNLRKIDQKKNYYAIRTWFDNRTTKSIKELKDTYFGILPKFLIEKGKNIILLGGILGDPLEFVEEIQIIRVKNLYIVPEYTFGKFRDFLLSYILSFVLKFKIDRPIIFKDVDVSPLIQEEFRKDEPFKTQRSIFRAICIKRMLSTYKIDFFTYTFENHSWEKIMLFYLRKIPNLDIIGYQHARVMKSLLNYFPSQHEKDIIPLPHKIITVGTHPKNILQKYGSYNKEQLNSGCALRYEYLYKTSKIPRKPLKKVLIALTASKEESAEIVKFVQKALKNSEYLPRYRCHPLVSFKSIKSKLKTEIQGSFEISDESSLNSDFFNCQTVIYTITTVCMEALMLGLPVIHIDLNEPINGDPLFECDHLRWVVKNPIKLIEVLDDIKNLGDKEFLNQQNKAREYLKDYFIDVSKENLEIFLR